MKKYILYRSLDVIDAEYDGQAPVDLDGHELVAIEYGEDIYVVSGALLKAAREDAGELEKYQRGFTAAAFDPEPIQHSRYSYHITAVLYPEYGEQNDLIEYGVVEEECVDCP